VKPPMTQKDSQPPCASRRELASRQVCRPISKCGGRKILRLMLQLLVLAALVTLPLPARSQVTAYSGESSGIVAGVTKAPLDLTYVRPTRRIEANNYVFDAFGPYPIVGATVAAGVNQFSNAPPEWRQGVEGYSRRFGSDFGIAAVGTTTRYALAQALREDTLYYRCECRGLFPRVEHAVLSTLTARRGDDGHRVFSLPALVAPYAGTMTAVYGWFPNRFGAKDAFRMGNYSLLAYMGGNIGLELFYSGPHSMLSRMHLNNMHAAPGPGPNH
jgi:hypothetical protein